MINFENMVKTHIVLSEEVMKKFTSNDVESAINKATYFGVIQGLKSALGLYADAVEIENMRLKDKKIGKIK